MTEDVFKHIYDINFWANDESVSGHGSDLQSTASIRLVLPMLFEDLKIKTLLDIPCGDYNWFKEMDTDVRYFGADVVKDLIASNFEKYSDENHTFRVMDITKDKLPEADLILCRDLLGHFSNSNVKAALRRMRASGAIYLQATTFPDHENSGDIKDGQWRPINLDRLWGLDPPIELINESCKVVGYEDKSLGLWKLN